MCSVEFAVVLYLTLPVERAVTCSVVFPLFLLLLLLLTDVVVTSSTSSATVSLAAADAVFFSVFDDDDDEDVLIVVSSTPKKYPKYSQIDNEKYSVLVLVAFVNNEIRWQ